MSKQPQPRRPKPGARGHLPTGALIALGPKSSRIPDSDLKPLQPPKPNQPPPPKKPIIPGSSERKREPSSISPSGGPKRTKVIGSPPYSSAKSGDIERRSSSSQFFASSPIEVSPSDLERLVLEAEANGDRTRIDGLLLGAIRSIKQTKNKPDSMAYLGLLYLAKCKPEYFASTRVVENLTSLLKRDVYLNKNNKTLASLVAIMAANILLYVFQDTDDWPESFVKVYVEDSLGDRLWVDTDSCQLFVSNILTAFGTKRHPKAISRQSSDPGSKTTAQSEQLPPVTGTTSTASFMPPSTSKDEEEVVVEEMDLSSNEEDVTSVIPRFTSPSVTHNITSFVMELIQEQLTRRQMVENISRNLLRLLMSTCGYVQIRLLVSHRMEIWLQNPKLTRPAQELLMSVCLNCTSHSHEDIEVISNLIRMRFKTKPLTNHYVTCIRELIGQHPDNLATVLKHVIYNELSSSRNPNNMSLLATMFQYNAEAASKILAMVFQDLLMNKEDYLRACRALLKEIVRFLRYGLNFVALCRGFMQERTDSQFKELDGTLKERMLTSLTDLITMATMLSITPTVKECSIGFSRGDSKGLPVLQEFQKTISTIQRDGVWWLHTVVPKMFTVSSQDFGTCLQKLLYLDPIDSYSTKDGWPQESDRSLFYSLVSEVPVQEDTLMRVIIIGLSSELPLNAPEALDIADRIVKRAAAVKTGVAQLKVTRQELLDATLNLCAYHHPKDIQLPSGYVPPKLAISNLYWKAWMLLTIVAALNPDSIGQSGWENFPMLKSLMEMIMTNSCVFPPPTTASSNEEKEQIIAQDRQLVQMEKEEILQFESHLAAATTGVAITESNSLLLSQLISMDPVGPTRKPPQSFMDELKAVNHSLKLGQKLCRSRSPDFLLDIIQRQGTSQSMPWLAELVQSSEGSLDVLPVQCLCEFLLMEQSSTDEDNQEKKMNNEKHVLSRLRSLLSGQPTADGSATVEVLEYFLRRLSSGVTKERNAAAKGLELVLSQENYKESVVSFSDDVSMVTAIEEMSVPETTSSTTLNTDFKWLLTNLPRLPHFETVRPICCYALRQCCQVEIVPQRLQAYLVFLSCHAGEPSDEDFTETLLEIAQLVIARPTIFNQVLEGSSFAMETFQALLGMYLKVVEYAVEVQDNSYFEGDMQDQLFAQWSKDTVHAGKAATMQALIIQASVLLLTWPEPSDNPKSYQELLDYWCPENGHIRVYLTDTGEEAVLLPEWLRLRMIRAESHRVVRAAMMDLDPPQLVLFAQSFGIPVYSMSQLLTRLDLAAKEDPSSVNEAVLDKGYMVQLVEVQQHRGAEGGDLFCSLLADRSFDKHTGSTFLAEEGLIKPFVIHPEQPAVMKGEPMKLPEIPNDNKEEIILKVLELKPVDGEDKCDAKYLEGVVKKHITNDLVKASKGETFEDSWSEVLISSLLKLLDSSDSENTILKTFHLKQSFLCTVIRLLMTRQNALQRVSKATSRFPELIKKLASRYCEDGPLASIVNQYKKQLGLTTEPSKTTSVYNILQAISQSKYNESLVRKFIAEAEHSEMEAIDKETAIQACLLVKSNNPQLLEQFCKSLFARIIYQSSQSEPAVQPWNSKQCLPIKSCVEILAGLLLHEDDKTQAGLTNGLFIDWLGSIDPEMVDVHPLLQRQILFSDRPHVNTQDRSAATDVTGSGNSYLLASLAHNSKYSTLEDCLDWLLGQHEHSNRIIPGAALDFLWTCHYIPRLWQGRGQTTTAQSTDYEDAVISLTPAQTCQVSQFVLTEVENAVKEFCCDKGLDFMEMSKNTDKTANLRSQASELVHSVLQKRIPLVLLCCRWKESYLEAVVSFIANSRWPKWIISPFLVYLYLAHPRVSSCWKHFDTLFASSAFTKAMQCQLDELCHCVLTVLADCRPGREYEDSAHTSSLLCRTLASKHPMLFLRHIPMISSLLRGRVHLTSKEFANNQHLLLFSHVLGILDVLRPLIFLPDKFIENGLQDTLDVYFQLVQSSCLGNKELPGIVSKLTEFLYEFCTHRPDQSLPVLQANSALLSDLLGSFPDLPPLKCLVNALSVPNGTTLPPPTGSSSTFHSMIMPLDITSWTPAQLAPVIQQLSPWQPLPDILNALNDLDETSKRRLDILQHFVTELIRLTCNDDSTVRSKAHTLIQRHVRQRPSDAYKFVGCFMDCLTCSSPAVALTAAKFIPEFTLLCSNFSSLLLEKLFSVAVNDRLDVVSSLVRSIQLLNLDFTK